MLLLACKTGDLEKAKHLVEVEQVPFNCRDQWDCSPLYYTALCGHIDVTRYLLASGAQCDPNTFEGERCYYGALNNKIRTLLRNNRFTKAIDADADYAIFLHKSLMMDSQNYYSDLSLVRRIKTPTLQNHRIQHPFSIASSRCPFLAYEFLRRFPKSSQIPIKSKLVPVPALRAFLVWMYTGELPRDEIDPALEFLARQWRATELLLLIKERKEFSGLSGGQQMKRTVITQRKPGLKTALPVPKDLQEYEDGLEMFRERMEKGLSSFPSTKELQSGAVLVASSRPDIIIALGDAHFPCHKSFLVRSEYFQALLMGGFLEANSTRSILPVSFTDSPEVFACILDFLYTDRCLRFSDDTVFMLELLRVADLLLLERFKTSCVNYLIALPIEAIDNPADLLRASWDMNLPRLEQFITKLYAQRFEEYLKDNEIKTLVYESAESVVNREEVDTVIFADDLRYWLSRLHGFDGEEDIGIQGKNGEVLVRIGQQVDERRCELDKKTGRLDDILDELGLFVAM
ncbi:hypothetical protein BCR33DRAFT_711555 [Rhizoclosmatium globosum]|uniref:BTB domain-containing protein n=1 Tax=Rhizoclosmatium globosum TaxID=329046 RepID=A0A1Y2D1R1_9FUNG|nr:hypothetical protein BCR33DRAFT_711555 [Rhizoclosmatium globosum]|eukprot:ORY53221.1 hypothetical protein BCR33DRAFT_711555 [Rhizoclosmatium globosum]